jgi:uncharacterized protein
VTVRRIGLALLALAAAGAGGAEVIPPPPAAHFNDYAGLVSTATAQALDRRLEQFERDTSDQVVVAIYPKMETDSSIEDYAVRVAQSWHAGIKGRDNGVVLFIFAQSHKIYMTVGYGLEGALPDALAKRIIEDEIAPAFRKGDYNGGVTAGVTAILAATKGEYRGTGRTVGRSGHGGIAPFVVLFSVVIFLSLLRRNSSVYQSSGRRGFGGGLLTGMFLGGGFGGGGGGGGGFGGGGFSGGGGGFGGGGAGGSW